MMQNLENIKVIGLFGMEVPLQLEPVKKDDDIYTIEEFGEIVSDGMFIDYDGFGELSYLEEKSNIVVSPSTYEKILAKYPELDFTHIVWYNK